MPLASSLNRLIAGVHDIIAALKSPTAN
jgi:hypothetical protein